MRESKGVYVTKRDIREHHREYQLYSNRVIRTREYSGDRARYESNTQEVGCQCEDKRDNMICTCKHISMSRRRQEIRYFSGSPKQIYAYHGSRSYTDIGVGSIKALPRKKVKRVYLPETDERGVGSSDLSSLLSNRKPKKNKGGSFYDHKKTSSKCVGGAIEFNTGGVTSAKLSPIIHTKSGTTSPAISTINDKNTEIEGNTAEKNLITIMTQFDDKDTQEVKMEDSKPEDSTAPTKKTSEQVPIQIKSKETIACTIDKNKSRINKRIKEPEKVFSSDSLVQHVHNLEMPSEDKQSRISIDPMENKLEREYRKMFSIKSKESKPSSEKPIPDFKSTSMLRRRFEALRRGIVKKEDSKKNAVIESKASHPSVPSCKDVSVASDPPSLEARSYSNTKTYSPFQSTAEYNKDIYNPSTSYKKSVTGRKERDSGQWSRNEGYDDEAQGVKGMFKVWGKKFNLEDEYYDEKTTPKPSYDIPKEIETKIETVKAKSKTQVKKEGRKFFFFKRKHKDKEKEKQPYKSKKGVTAGRCEVRDGLMIKIGTAGGYNKEEIKQPEIVSPEYEEMLRKAWLTKYLSHKIDSRKSVQVRWNNKTYATSSSTIFELMDNVYKETGVVFRSKSEVTTGESSYYRSYTRQRVNFMQNIEAWMIPTTIPDRPKDLPIKYHYGDKENIEVRISDQKWFIDKSKAFSHNIEVVLHSNNFVKMNKDASSEYLRIDIPKGFFVDSCSDDDRQNQSSIEEVYKIVEYESATAMKKHRKLDGGDQVSSDIKVTVCVKDSKDIESRILETVIKTPPDIRDVVIQGSNVYIPKRCDVIGVGIITQRDLREMTKPILKIQDDEISDDESDVLLRVTHKKCEFAESYLHDYYRNWTPLGIDLFSWCVSDSHLRCCSDTSPPSLNYQGDGSKSCPNIYDDYHASTVVSSCATSSCSHCNTYDDDKPDKNIGSKFFNKFKKKPKENPDKRYLPKDSLEVYKRRRIYARSNKSKWGTADDKPYSVPSIEDKCAQKDTMIECPKSKKSCCKPIEAKPRPRECKKHVSLPDCETMNDILAKLDEIPEGILSFKGASGCDACKLKKGVKCPKHAVMDKKPPCQIQLPPCMPKCEKAKKPACFTPNSPSCNVSPPCTPPCKIPSCPISSSSSSSSLKSPCSTPPRTSPPCTPSPTPSGVKLSSPPHTPPCKQSPPPCPKPSPPCKKPSPPCQKPSPPCLKPSQPCPKPSPPCPSPPPPCIKPPPCPEPPPPCSPPPCPPPPCPPEPCPSPPTKKKKKKSLLKCITGKKSSSTCDSPRSPRLSNCQLPMCPQCKSSEGVFPWPAKKSSNASTDSCPPKPKICAMKKCPIKNIPSNLSVKKECKPNCANRKRSPSPNRSASPKVCSGKSKISGLFLKIKSSNKKPCSKECVAGFNTNDKRDGVFRSNSEDSITIRVKKESPSTEEIREGLNIKVQDEDGQTLYERKDYRQGNKKGCGHRPSVLGDMYKDSNVHRLSAPTIVKNVTSDTQGHEEAIEHKSDGSVTNLVEIQFKLRVTQGDKTTEINVGNDDDKECEKIDKANQRNNPQGIYILKNEELHSGEDTNSNNDINIRIVIKNYKPQNKIKNFANDEFSKEISDKFHTVSTGYSDVLNQNADNVYSIRRTAVDLTSSMEKSTIQSKPSDEVLADEVVEREPINLMSSNSDKSDTDLESKTDVNTEKSTTSKKEIADLSETSRSHGDKYDSRNATDTDADVLDLNKSECENNDDSDDKHDSKDKKKEMFKDLMEKVHNTDTKNKKKMKKLRDMLKQVLTSDSSGLEDMTHVSSNELAKDVTYASLKPNYFRDTDSMNNYYKMDSTALSSNASKIDSPKLTYPTRENNSVCSGNSDDDSTDTEKVVKKGCMCSTLAARLNLSDVGEGRGCCCRGSTKKNEETYCDLRNDEDFYLLNYKTDHADVETQNSRHLSSKMNSANVLVSHMKINETKNVAAEVVDLIETRDQVTITKTFSPHKNHIKECEMKKFNRNTMLSISNEDEIVVLEAKQTKLIQEHNKIKERERQREKRKRKKQEKRAEFAQGADILQSYETKKAVLEIYAQKTISDGTEHLVAKLPKFAYERESEIRLNYEEIAEHNYTNLCNNNILMMSYNR